MSIRLTISTFALTLLSVPVAAQNQDFPEGPGKPLFTQYCGGCHDINRSRAGYTSRAKPNTIVRFDPKTEKFQSWAIPGGGDIVRNMDVLPDGNPVMANSLVNQVGVVEIK